MATFAQILCSNSHLARNLPKLVLVMNPIDADTCTRTFITREDMSLVANWPGLSLGRVWVVFLVVLWRGLDGIWFD